MLKSIRDFFERYLAPVGDRAPSRHTIELATAALLIEVVRCDAGITEACKRGEEVRAKDRALETAQPGGSSYVGSDPAAAVAGIIARNNSVNAANCARASQGASIICNTN